MCLSVRDCRQLKANLWRSKTVLRREPGRVRAAFLQPIIFLSALLILNFTAFKPTMEETLPFEANDWTVTTSETNAISTWPGDETLQSNFSLLNCTVMNGLNVGLVKPAGDQYTRSNEALDNIFTALNGAYTELQDENRTLIAKNYTNNDDLEAYIRSSESSKNPICFALLWKTFDIENDNFDIEIRPNNIYSQQTQLDQIEQQSLEINVNLIWQYGAMFQQIMATVTNEIIQNQYGAEGNFTLMTTPLPTGEYVNAGGFAATLAGLLPFVIILWANLGSVVADAAKEENEDKLENILKRIGYKPIVEVYRSFIVMAVFTLLVFTPVALITLFLTMPQVNPIIGVLFFIMQPIQMWFIDQDFKFLFGKKYLYPKMIFYVGQIFYLISLAFNPVFDYGKLVTLSLLPMTQQMAFCQLLIKNINEGTKMSFSNFDEPILAGYSTQDAFIFVGITSAIWLIIFLYLIPLKLAIDEENPLRWYYPCVCGCIRKRRNNQNLVEDENDNEIEQPLLASALGGDILEDSKRTQNQSDDLLTEDEKGYVAKGIMEKLSGSEPTSRVAIEKLVKKFGSKKAVNNLSMTLFKNEILVLLGHNGAGKTTTINMLTGLTKPTSGSANAIDILPGQDIDLFADYENLVDLIGVCPQEDVLISRLTVEENLKFFCLFKSIENSEHIIEEILDKYNLAAKRDTQAKSLSGGQKRKLQLAIALMGDAKIVLLDEPSSGMDPTARREAWDIIQNAKRDRVIILTTHYMDEAEYLADRVAIVSKGSLQACGSSLFLKRKYGQGIYIEIEPVQDQTSENEAFTALINDQLKELEYSKKITVKQNEQGKIVYELPFQIAEKFGILAHEMDNNKEQYAIKDYEIRNSTLEEVFIRLGQMEQQQDEKEEQLEQDGVDEYEPEFIENSCCQLLSASLEYQFKTSIGLAIVVFVGSILVGLFALFFYRFSQVNYCIELNYTDMGSIYSPVTPMDLYYNTQTEGTEESTADFMATIFSSAGQGTLTPKPETWGKQPSNETYTQYKQQLVSDIPPGTFGTYDITKLDLGTDKEINAIVYYSLESDASIGSFSGVMLQSIARQFTSKPNLNIAFTNYPLPQMGIQLNVGVGQVFTALLLFVLLAVDAISIRLIISRIEDGFYDTMLMSGATRFTFWTAQYLKDVMTLMMFGIIFYTILTLFADLVGGFIEMYTLFALAQPLYWYTWTFFFSAVLNKKGNLATIFLLILPITGQTLFSSFVALRQQSELSIQKSTTTNMFAAGFLCPTANFFMGMGTSLTTYFSHKAHVDNDPEEMLKGETWYGQYGAKYQLYASAILLVAYFSLFCLLVSGCCFRKPKPEEVQPVRPENEDADVKAERERVKNVMEGQGGETLLVNDLVKQYNKVDPNADKDEGLDQSSRSRGSMRSDRPTQYGAGEEEEKKDQKKGTLAVKGTSFGVGAGECFALLGVNGAGKSTTFNCLTGNDVASGGTVLLDGVNVNNYYRKPHLMHKVIGFCPQTNCIDAQTPVRTTLIYSAKLVGIKPDQVERAVTSIMEKCDLSAHAKTAAGSLSGGNKRKLCLAMALIGRPKIIYVDEASAGVDPAARRAMWRAIKSEGKNSAVVITTHAMEEAEALASKLGIMVQGAFKCVGSTNQIKVKWGSGYEIELNLDLQDILKELEDITEAECMTNDSEVVKRRLNEWQETLRNLDFPIMLKFEDEFSRFGLLGNFFTAIRKNEQVDLRSVRREVVLQNLVGAISEELSKKASECFVQQLDGAYVRLKLDKNDKSYGQMYHLLEQMKEKYFMKEYQIKQSTLEQVFNTFATEDGYAFLNRRLTQGRRTSIMTD